MSGGITGVQWALIALCIVGSQVCVTLLLWWGLDEWRSYYSGYLQGHARMLDAVAKAETNPAIRAFGVSGEYPKPQVTPRLNPDWDDDDARWDDDEEEDTEEEPDEPAEPTIEQEPPAPPAPAAISVRQAMHTLATVPFDALRKAVDTWR